jgi:HEAT repeat protein
VSAQDTRSICLLELTSGDDQRAEAAAVGIAALPAAQVDETLAELRALLAAPEVERRWWATRALAGISDQSVMALLLQALADEAPSVRQCAALGLRHHPEQEATSALIAALADDDHLVARLAADALIQIGEAAVSALLDIFQNANHHVRLEAARALAFIGDPRAIPALFAALDEDSALIEYWASEGLERMGVGMSFFQPE